MHNYMFRDAAVQLLVSKVISAGFCIYLTTCFYLYLAKLSTSVTNEQCTELVRLQEETAPKKVSGFKATHFGSIIDNFLCPLEQVNHFKKPSGS